MVIVNSSHKMKATGGNFNATSTKQILNISIYLISSWKYLYDEVWIFIRWSQIATSCLVSSLFLRQVQECWVHYLSRYPWACGWKNKAYEVTVKLAHHVWCRHISEEKDRQIVGSVWAELSKLESEDGKNKIDTKEEKTEKKGRWREIGDVAWIGMGIKNWNHWERGASLEKLLKSTLSQFRMTLRKFRILAIMQTCFLTAFRKNPILHLDRNLAITEPFYLKNFLR